MFEILRLRLTVICTVITGAILVAMACVSLYTSERQLAQRGTASFKSDVNAILFHVRSQNVLDHTWLSQTEASGKLMLYLEDSGKPLLFAGSSTGEANGALVITAADLPVRSGGTNSMTYEVILERVNLLLQIKKQALDTRGLDIAKEPRSSFTADTTFFDDVRDASGQKYYAAAAAIPVGDGWIGLTVAKSLADEQAQIMGLRGMYAGLVALSVVLLGLFAWFFTARAIRPVEENRRRQMQFVSAASHELRSPLAVIQTSVSAMQTAPPEQSERFARSVDSECTRMSRLIEDMLSLAGADSGNWSVRKEETDLETLLLTAMERFEAMAAQKHISITVELPTETLPKCQCDPNRIAQVLAILLDNAVSYTQNGGKIRLSAARTLRGVKICVTDNGAGVPDAQKELIFERFYRSDASRSQKEHYGLGLCIAREIASLHKGKLTVGDTAGGGAVFALTLPLKAGGVLSTGMQIN